MGYNTQQNETDAISSPERLGSVKCKRCNGTGFVYGMGGPKLLFAEWDCPLCKGGFESKDDNKNKET
ncbi:MAG: hypothetical protein M0R48_10595 [Candidatus Omnitrophica bacterium]|nr:hypothetical protein [Candidatus Omnitrophota bacterium]